VTPADLVDRVRLIRSPSIGPITFRQLLARFGSAAAALEAIPDLAARGGGRRPPLFPRTRPGARSSGSRRSAGAIWRSAKASTHGSWRSGRRTAAADHAGDIGLLDRPLVSMVGARNASAAACRFARTLAHDLGREGQVVVSGLARGIDAAVHEGALASGTIG
jgi:DNA processing protein